MFVASCLEILSKLGFNLVIASILLPYIRRCFKWFPYTNLLNSHYEVGANNPHFTLEETEAQRNIRTCLGSTPS
jgi:hypothetical protein